MLLRSSESGVFVFLSLTFLCRRLVDCYASYFGAFTTVAWSPDGRFILVRNILCTFDNFPFAERILRQTGGQDDLLTIFSPWEQRVVARCQGHSSFVASVA